MIIPFTTLKIDPYFTVADTLHNSYFGTAIQPYAYTIFVRSAPGPVLDTYTQIAAANPNNDPTISDNAHLAPFIKTNDNDTSRDDVNDQYSEGNYGTLGFVGFATEGDLSPQYTEDEGETFFDINATGKGNNGYLGGFFGLFNNGDVSPKGWTNGYVGGVWGVGNIGNVSPTGRENGTFGGVWGAGNQGDVAPEAETGNGNVGGVNGILNEGSVSPKSDTHNGQYSGVTGIGNAGDVSPEAQKSNGLYTIAILNNGDVAPKAGTTNGVTLSVLSNGDVAQDSGKGNPATVAVLNNGDVKPHAGTNNDAIIAVANDGDVSPTANGTNALFGGTTGVLSNGDVNPHAGANNGGVLGVAGGTTGIANNGSVSPSAGQSNGTTIGVLNNGDVSPTTRGETQSSESYNFLTIGLLNAGDVSQHSTKQGGFGQTLVGFNRSGVLSYQQTNAGLAGQYNTDINTYFVLDFVMSTYYGDDYVISGEKLRAPTPQDPNDLLLAFSFTGLNIPTAQDVIFTVGDTLGQIQSIELTDETRVVQDQLESTLATVDQAYADNVETIAVPETPTFEAERQQLDQAIADAQVFETINSVELPSTEDYPLPELPEVSPGDVPEVPVPGLEGGEGSPNFLDFAENVNQVPEAPTSPEEPTPQSLVDYFIAVESYGLDLVELGFTTVNQALPTAEELQFLIDQVQQVPGVLEEIDTPLPGDDPLDAVMFIVDAQDEYIDRASQIVADEVQFYQDYGTGQQGQVMLYADSVRADYEAALMDLVA